MNDAEWNKCRECGRVFSRPAMLFAHRTRERKALADRAIWAKVARSVPVIVTNAYAGQCVRSGFIGAVVRTGEE